MTDDLHSQIDPYDYYEAMQSGTRAEQMFHAGRVRLVVDVAAGEGKRVLDVGAGSGCLSIPPTSGPAAIIALALQFPLCICQLSLPLRLRGFHPLARARSFQTSLPSFVHCLGGFSRNASGVGIRP